MKWFCFYSVFGLSVALGLSHPAQVCAEEKEDVIEVRGEPEDLRAPSAWRTSLKARDLRLQGLELADGVDSLPGVHVQRSGGEGSASKITLRGASAQQVLVHLDGIPLNAVRGGGTDLSLIPPSLLDDVVVHRGGSAARFGSGALGGALELKPLAPEQGGKWSVSGGGGSFGTRRYGLGVAGGSREISAVLAVDWLETGGDFSFVDEQGTEHVRVNADSRRLGGMGSIFWRPSSRDQITLTELGSWLERGVPGPSEFQQALDEARGEEFRNTLALSWKRQRAWRSGEAEADTTVRLGWRRDQSAYQNPDRLLRSSVAYDTRADEEGFFGALETLGVASDWFFFHASAEGSLQDQNRRELVASGEYERERFSRWGGALVVGGEALLAGEALSLLGALRGEATEGFGVTPAPSLGFVARPSSVWVVQGNAARAWRAPGFDELYLKQEFLEGDPSLSPEDAWSFDLGARFSPHDRFSTELVAFWLEIENLILFLPVSAVLFRAQNTGSVRSQGVEWSARWFPVSWLSVEGGYTWTFARFLLEPGDRLPGRPEHKGWGEVRGHYEIAQAFVRGRARGRVFLDNFESLQNEGAFFLDAGVLVDVWRALRVGVQGRNLLDERGVVDALQTPQPGISFHLQVTWEGEWGEED